MIRGENGDTHQLACVTKASVKATTAHTILSCKFCDSMLCEPCWFCGQAGVALHSGSWPLSLPLDRVTHTHTLHSSDTLNLTIPHTSHTFQDSAASLSNALLPAIKSSDNFRSFSKLQTVDVFCYSVGWLAWLFQFTLSHYTLYVGSS